jgi:hypothetical protein
MIDRENKDLKVTAPIDGMSALVHAFANLPHDKAYYKRDKLQTPTTDTFGTHIERRRLVEGRARIQQEIDAGAGYTLMFSSIDRDGAKRVIGIGRTPDELNPDRGGQFYITADRDGHGAKDYLMLVHDGVKDVPPHAFYLSAEQLNDVTLAPGDEDVTFNPVAMRDDPTRGKVIQVQGRVENVIVLE